MTEQARKGELTRIIRLRPLPGDSVIVEANSAELAALAGRFSLPAVHNLRAEVTLEMDGTSVIARGNLTASLIQNCAVSGDEFAVSIDEPVLLRFVEAQGTLPDDEGNEEIEIELSDEDCDEIEYAGDTIDLGEAIAQSLGLAIDPYAEGPNAEAVRQKAGILGDDEPSGPLADALKGLKLN